MTTQSFDSAKSEAFSERFAEIVNNGALALMSSIGHRTGLFDIMAELEPSTSAQIAEAAGLNERYVREWLAAMTTGRFVDYDPETATYVLPAEHAAWLTRKSTPNNFAVMAQYFPVLAGIEDRIIECFHYGGGVAYEEYDRLYDVLTEDTDQVTLIPLIDHILPAVPGLIERLREGIDVLDVGCGSGRALNRMAAEFPTSRFFGYDLSDDAIGRARTEAKKLGLTNVSFEIKDLTDFDIEGGFDLVTAFDAIHDQARPDLVLSGICRVLKDDGVFLMQDIAGSSYLEKNLDHPIAPLLYTISCLHCMTVSLAQEGGMGLGTLWGQETALKMLREAGFASTTVTNLPHDFQNSYYISRKEAVDQTDSERKTAAA